MMPDPKWLDILKASGWKTTALAVAFGLFILIAHWGWFSALPDWVIPGAAFGFLVCGCLALASIGSTAFKFFPIQERIVHWLNVEREKRAARNYIPHMTREERAIIAYLLARNQTIFVANRDGGYAMTLISRGFVMPALQPGQAFYEADTPMAIPDHIWDVFVRHKDQFPYKPPEHGEYEGHPWRVPWEE